MRDAARTFVLVICACAAACVQAPQQAKGGDTKGGDAAADVAGARNANGNTALRPLEGLTFSPRSFSDGSNVDPVFDDTTYEASDGERVTSKQYHFRRPEGAAEFYSKELARARAVLATETQSAAQGVDERRRAVVEFDAKDGGPRAAVLKLTGSFVNEIVGPSVGHVLALEQWGGANR